MGLLGVPNQSPVTTDAFRHIDTTVLAAPAASVSFTGISSTYRSFIVSIYTKNDANAKQSYLRLNNDSSAKYDHQNITAQSTTITGARTTGGTQWTLNQTDNMAASQETYTSVFISKPAAAVKGVMSHLSSYEAAGGISLEAHAGIWNNTADLINRIDVIASANNYAANTRISIHGADAS